MGVATAKWECACFYPALLRVVSTVCLMGNVLGITWEWLGWALRASWAAARRFIRNPNDAMFIPNARASSFLLSVSVSAGARDPCGIVPPRR